MKVIRLLSLIVLMSLAARANDIHRSPSGREVLTPAQYFAQKRAIGRHGLETLLRWDRTGRVSVQSVIALNPDLGPQLLKLVEREQKKIADYQQTEKFKQRHREKKAQKTFETLLRLNQFYDRLQSAIRSQTKNKRPAAVHLVPKKAKQPLVIFPSFSTNPPKSAR